MRNRSNTPARDESDFINGGSAGIDAPKAKPAKAKTFPTTFSLTQDTLNGIDGHRQNAALAGLVGVTRTDIMRAAMHVLDGLPEDKVVSILRTLKGK